MREVLIVKPDHPAAKHLYRQLRERQEAQQRSAQISKVDDCVSRREYQEAIETLQGLLKRAPWDESVRSRLAHVTDLLEKKRRADKLIAEANDDLRGEALSSAYSKVLLAGEADPGNPQIERFRIEIKARIETQRRDQRRREVFSEVEKACERREYESALSLLDELEKEQPNLPQIRSIRPGIEKQYAKYQEGRRLEERLSAVKLLINSDDLKRASQISRDLKADFPNEPEVDRLLTQIKERMAARARLEAIAKVSIEINALIESGNHKTAVQVTLNALATYGEERSLRLLHEKAEKLERAQKRRDLIFETSLKVDSLRLGAS